MLTIWLIAGMVAEDPGGVRGARRLGGEGGDGARHQCQHRSHLAQVSASAVRTVSLRLICVIRDPMPERQQPPTPAVELRLF